MSIADEIGGTGTAPRPAPRRLFDDQFLRRVRDDPVSAVVEICKRALAMVERDPDSWDEDDLNGLIEAYALLREMAAGALIEIDLHEPELTGPLEEDCRKLIDFLSGMKKAYVPRRNERLLEVQSNRFRLSLGTGFLYEFTQGDLDRIQALINELRELISTSTLFEEDHRQRLLARLEKLQTEMHKKVSDLDRWWGLFGDAGVAIGKFGKDVKPIVDRVREIVDIVWRTQARAEELPSGTKPPLIEDRSDE